MSPTLPTRPGRERGGTRLDQRSVWVLDTHDLTRRPGSMQELSLDLPAPAELEVAVSRVPQSSPIHLELRLESVVDGVLLTGTVDAAVEAECIRCLDPVELVLEADLQELYRYPESDAHGHLVHGAGAPRRGGYEPTAPMDSPDELETSSLDGELLNLEPLLRDAVVLELPLQPLCDPDCPGLCARCGIRLADEPDHGHVELDSRWAVLADLAGADQTLAPSGEREMTDVPVSGHKITEE